MSVIAEVCKWALEEQIENQWKWPRESDLVVDLVAKIKSSLGDDAYSSFSIAKKKNNSNKVSQEIQGKQTLIVRTEAKINDDNEKIDICILNKNPTYYFGNYGSRDILLSVDSSDVREVLEVKLDPHTLGYWINDICKLAKLQNKEEGNIEGLLHLLAIDNSLILGEPLRNSKRSKDKWKWPLEHDENIEIKGFSTKSEPPVDIKMEHVSLPVKEPLEPGVYLWALGVKDNNKLVEASPSCWKLEQLCESS